MAGGRLAGPRDARAALDERRARRAEVTDPDVVMEAAALFLAVRPRSVAETRRRLLHLGYPAAPVTVVIDRLLALGYLDDAAFAQAWVEARDRSRPRGAAVLRRELGAKGLDPAVVRAALDGRIAPSDAGHASRDIGIAPDTGSADRDAARRLLARRAPALGREPDLRKRRHRAYALLARNGFDPGICAEESARVAATPDEDELLLEDDLLQEVRSQP